jgi:hypothetical protein
MLLLVQYAVTCHAITVAYYHFTWCSVVANTIFSTCFGTIICYTDKFYLENFLSFLIIWRGTV